MKRYTLILLSTMLISHQLSAQIFVTREWCRQQALQESGLIKTAKIEQKMSMQKRKSIRAAYYPALSLNSMALYQQAKSNYSLSGGFLPTYVPGADGKLEPNILKNPSTGAPVIGPDGKPVFASYAFLPDIDVSIDMRGVYDIGLQLEQPIYMGGKIRSAVAAAKDGEDIASQSLYNQTLNIAYDTDKAYLNWIEAQEMTQVAQKYIQLLAEVKEQVSNAIRVGMSMKNDLLEVTIKENEAELMLQKAKQATTLSSMNLCRLLKLPLSTQLIKNDSLGERIDPHIWELDSTPSQRPDYKILKKAVELYDHEIDITRSSFLPQLGISAGYFYTGGIEVNGDEDHQGSLRAMASLEIPIFKWGEGKNKVRVAKNKKEISQIKLEDAADLMRLEIASERFNVINSQKQVSIAQISIRDANENIRIAKNSFSNGMIDITQLLEAQLSWQKAYYSWIKAKATLQLSETAYLKSIGQMNQ